MNICAICQSHGPAPHPSTFAGDMYLMNTTGYIHWFHITDEYIVTFISTDEQVDLNLSKLHSSVVLLVNRQICITFVGLEGKFIGFD
jgi:hypothetical protein